MNTMDDYWIELNYGITDIERLVWSNEDWKKQIPKELWLQFVVRQQKSNKPHDTSVSATFLVKLKADGVMIFNHLKMFNHFGEGGIARLFFIVLA